MRARAAVIPSLGTTGILLAAALLMLALVSALVAFRAWPGGTGETVPSVPVTQEAGSRVDLKQVRTATAPRAVKRAAPVAARAAAPRATTAGLVKTTVVDASPTDVVKVPPGVRMTLPPAQTPTARPVAPPIETPQPPAPDAGGDPSLLPQEVVPPAGPGDVGNTVTELVQPGPGDGSSAAPQISVAPDDATIIGVTVGSTTISVGLG
jgi:hypothetical protein